jgi:hypothetical protein
MTPEHFAKQEHRPHALELLRNLREQLEAKAEQASSSHASADQPHPDHALQDQPPAQQKPQAGSAKE